MPINPDEPKRYSIVIRDKEGKIIAKHEPEHGVGDVVYLITDPEQHKRLVLKYEVGLESFQYVLGCAADAEPSLNYGFEISSAKDVI